MLLRFAEEFLSDALWRWCWSESAVASFCSLRAGCGLPRDANNVSNSRGLNVSLNCSNASCWWASTISGALPFFPGLVLCCSTSFRRESSSVHARTRPVMSSWAPKKYLTLPYWSRSGTHIMRLIKGDPSLRLFRKQFVNYGLEKRRSLLTSSTALRSVRARRWASHENDQLPADQFWVPLKIDNCDQEHKSADIGSSYEILLLINRKILVYSDGGDSCLQMQIQ